MASKKDIWLDMVCGEVENAEEEGLGDKGSDGIVKRRDDALLYPPTHARCLAARNVFFNTCAIDSDRCSGVDVVDSSVLW
jgi:hypothetical protein